MNRGENELLSECYRNEQRTRSRVLAGLAIAVVASVMFAVGYFIQ